MMREIKFRAWDKENGLMIKDNPLRGFPLTMTWTGNVYVDGKLQDYFMMQYTGLKDKHSKEIYEGDIVRHSSITGTVIYHDGLFAIDSIRVEPSLPLFYTSPEKIEIIGNIYEEPESLND